MAIAVLGEAIVDLILQSNGQYQPHLGGSPFNVAVCAARQNANTVYLSPLSDDQFGDQFASRLSTEGVHQAVSNRSSLPTSLALINLSDKGQPTYRLYRQGVADKDINADAILSAIPKDTEIFHTGSLAITPDYLPTIAAVINELKMRKVLISIDINIRDKAWADAEQYRSGVESLLSLADILKASDEDLSFLMPKAQPQTAARRCLERMSDESADALVLFTTGSEGGALLIGNLLLDFVAKQVGDFVDAIGAGDTFYGTFLSQLLKIKSARALSAISQQELQSVLLYAATAAGINVSRAGCNPPTLAELEEAISSTLLEE